MPTIRQREPKMQTTFAIIRTECAHIEATTTVVQQLAKFPIYSQVLTAK